MGNTLVVMAAGMGSRFGGLKQTESITEDGRTILDFSVYDAIKAGFSKVVFIIRREMFAQFKKLVGNRIAALIEVDYVFQSELDVPKERKKPFGTGHAILCCKGIVKEPFAVINADDYYGPSAFYQMQRHLSKAQNGEWAMIAYRLENTLSKNGGVSRGVCKVNDGYLESVTEITNIDCKCGYIKDGKREFLAPETLVSMNMWGLTPDVFEALETDYRWFLKRADLSKDEIYIPSVISKAVERGKAQVKVFKTLDKWYGITYREDLEEIKNAIGGYIENGLYERA